MGLPEDPIGREALTSDTDAPRLAAGAFRARGRGSLGRGDPGGEYLVGGVVR